MKFDFRRDRERGNIYKGLAETFCKHEPDYDSVILQKDETLKSQKVKGYIQLAHQTSRDHKMYKFDKGDLKSI